MRITSSNNTNKLSPQEHHLHKPLQLFRSNNTNKLSPQERMRFILMRITVQIIQINLVLKNVSIHETSVLKFK